MSFLFLWFRKIFSKAFSKVIANFSRSGISAPFGIASGNTKVLRSAGVRSAGVRSAGVRSAAGGADFLADLTLGAIILWSSSGLNLS